jgi:hypothetical protein
MNYDDLCKEISGASRITDIVKYFFKNNDLLAGLFFSPCYAKESYMFISIHAKRRECTDDFFNFEQTPDEDERSENAVETLIQNLFRTRFHSVSLDIGRM